MGRRHELAPCRRARNEAVTGFGVFTWHENPRYRASEAVRVFKHEKAAQKFADRENARDARLNYVVRDMKYVHEHAGFLSNPVHGSALAQGNRLYSGFMLRGAKGSRRVNVPALPKVALDIGTVTAIEYATNRGGRPATYRHSFRKGSRPLFAVSHDGKQLILLGGAFRFTHRGIVDK